MNKKYYSFNNKDFYLLLLALVLGLSFYTYDQELNWSYTKERILFADFFHSPIAKYSIPFEGFANLECNIYMNILPGPDFNFKKFDIKAFEYTVHTSLKDDKNNVLYETSSQCCADDNYGTFRFNDEEKRIRFDLIRDWKLRKNKNYKVEILFQSKEPIFENKYVEVVVDRYTNAEGALGFLILKFSVIIFLILIIVTLVDRQCRLYIASRKNDTPKLL